MKFLVVVLSLVLSVSSVQSVQAATILVFGQSTGLNLFTGNETAGTTVLDANSIPVTITTLNEVGVSLPALFSLDATSTGAAVNVFGNAWVQPYSGTFSVLSGGGFNFLSGVFSGIQLGIVGGQSLTFGSAQPPLSLTFTSDVVGMPLDDPTAFSLSLTNVNPSVQIVNNSFADFDSNVSGTASAVVPEPTSLILLGTGLLLGVRRFRSRQ